MPDPVPIQSNAQSNAVNSEANAVRTATIVTPKPVSLPRKLLASMIYGCIRCVAATLRTDLKDESGFASGTPKEPAIYAVWHNRLALSLMMYRRFVCGGDWSRRMAAIVSASRDGGVVARVLKHFGVEPVRGSSSRRGPQALLELVSAAEKGWDLAITPDGPRGPCYHVQDGVIALAQLTGLPVIPVSYSLSLKIRIKSWDRFQVPLPFSKWHVRFGQPLRVGRQSTEAEREAFRSELENRLQTITDD